MKRQKACKCWNGGMFLPNSLLLYLLALSFFFYISCVDDSIFFLHTTDSPAFLLSSHSLCLPPHMEISHSLPSTPWTCPSSSAFPFTKTNSSLSINPTNQEMIRDTDSQDTQIVPAMQWRGMLKPWCNVEWQSSNQKKVRDHNKRWIKQFLFPYSSLLLI